MHCNVLDIGDQTVSGSPISPVTTRHSRSPSFPVQFGSIEVFCRNTDDSIVVWD